LDQVLGLVMLAAYIVAVVGLAAGITWAIVKIFPTERGDAKPDEPKKEASSNDAAPGGRLFRRAKRAS
jgi:hypothetical protein